MLKEGEKNIQSGHFIQSKVERGDDYNCKNITIHSMPKRFLSVTDKNQKKAKGAGVLILIGGGLVLVVIFVSLYFYFFKPKTDIVPAPIDNAAASNKTGVENNKPVKDTGIDSAKKIEEPIKKDENSNKISINPNGEATTTATSSPQATTTSAVDNASTTTIKKVEEVVEARNSVDSDLDGLSDLEEAIFGTDSSKKDSDGDTYLDLSEVLGLYNPAGNGSIMANSGIDKYENLSYGYYLYRPKAWSVEKLGDDASIMIKTGNNQFININVQQNKDNQTIDEWYRANIDAGSITSDQRVYKQGWTGVKNKSGLIVYLLSKNNLIFTLNYNLGVENVTHYKGIFNMIINSLEISGR